jgi:hypothetical protein
MIKTIIAGLAIGLLSSLALASEPRVAPQPRGHEGWCGIVESAAGCETRGTILLGFRCWCPWDIVAPSVTSRKP